MTAIEIKQAVDQGKKVHWSNTGYAVIKDKNNEYLIQHLNGHCIWLTWRDGETINGNEEDFFIEE